MGKKGSNDKKKQRQNTWADACKAAMPNGNMPIFTITSLKWRMRKGGRGSYLRLWDNESSRLAMIFQETEVLTRKSGHGKIALYNCILLVLFANHGKKERDHVHPYKMIAAAFSITSYHEVIWSFFLSRPYGTLVSLSRPEKNEECCYMRKL